MIGKKKTTEEFIKECEDKNIIYNLSRAVYKTAKEKICAICHKHGEFWITPDNLLQGKGCPECAKEKNSINRRKTIEKFREEIEKNYPHKFDLTESVYIDAKTKIKVICHEKDEFGNEHGEFWVTPDHLLRGQGCPKCNSILYKKYIPYLYKQGLELIEYNSNKNNKYPKLKLKCIKHNCVFEIYTRQILNWEYLCPECRNEHSLENEKKIFIERSNKRHNYFYIYDYVDFVNYTTKVRIICPIHGEFYATPNALLSGKGCPKCMGKYKTTDDIINEFRLIHGDKFDYSKVFYEKATKKVCIICPEHGEFWMTPNKHLFGQSCPKCKESHLERSVSNYLNKHNIEYIPQYSNKDIIGLKRCDFYLKKYNIVIECQGKQHIGYIGGWNTETLYKELLHRDIDKYYELNNAGIKIYYLFNKCIFNPNIYNDNSFQGIYNEENTYTNLNDLIDKIKTDYYDKEKEEKPD